jgi:lipopolysaccharide export system ATP-binding protein
MNPILRADSIAKSFRGKRILSAATLRAVPGELRVLFGRNGIGKSTLLKIAAGLVQPDAGAVHFDGRFYESASLSALAGAGLFYLPDHDLLSSAFSVRKQLEMFRRQYNGAAVDESAAKLGIADQMDKPPTALSGGERRRAELAAVLVRRPKCLLADEPFRGITPRDAEDLTHVFVDMAVQGMAVVITGHDVPVLLNAAHHVSWCTSGTTYELGPPAAAVLHDGFRRDYLGTTWSQATAS